eukprot:2600972-Pyramimonas_sp.AAC.2
MLGLHPGGDPTGWVESGIVPGSTCGRASANVAVSASAKCPPAESPPTTILSARHRYYMQVIHHNNLEPPPNPKP